MIRTLSSLKNISLFAILFCAINLSARHYVGGVLTYQYLGSNQYELNIRVYRDCNPGNTAFPPNIRISIRDTSGTELQSQNAPRGTIVPVSLDTSRCVKAPPGVCIEYSDYTITATLPPIPGGYLIDADPCCRNGIISNIPNPLSAGYVYNTNISNGIVGNSTPTFGGVPPVLLCLGRPVDLDFMVTDVDNDSLSYEICEIYSDAYPYVPITFLAPYTPQYPLPSAPAMSVDPVTGRLTGTPNQLGQYVMGICVTEWRNGVPLSTIRLDYQFNVTNCSNYYSDVITQIEDTSLLCKGLTMNFTSQSQNATKLLWDFGDPNITTDTSSQANPTYTYNQPGNYLVTLIAEPGDTCADTAFAFFDVRDPVFAGFDVDTLYCFPQQPIQFMPNVTNPAPANFNWDFGPFATPPTSNQEVPPGVTWSQGGNHYVELTVTNGKCIAVYGDTVRITPELTADILTPLEDPTITCNGLTIQFTSESVGATNLHWDFGDGATLADTSNQANPTYTYPAPGLYTVTLRAGQNGQCFDEATFVFNIFEPLDPQISKSGIFCFEGQDILLQAQGLYPQGTTFQWDLGVRANRPFATTRLVPHVAFDTAGTYPISLTATNGPCIATVYDTITTEAWSVNADAGPNQVLKPGELLTLDGSFGSDYYWSSSHAVQISNPFGRNPDVELFHQGDSIYFYYIVTDEKGCKGRDTMSVYVTPNIGGGGYNILTANGDGRNDFLDLSQYITGPGCGLTVLNRWGSEVYKVEEYLNDWTGVDNSSNPLPDGTYYYVLFCDRQIVLKGPVTIINSMQ